MNIFKKNHKWRIPVVQQLTQYECGLSCLKMMLSYYKYDISMNELRKYFDSNVNGISLFDLKSVAIKLNLDVYIKKVDISILFNLKKINPFMITWNNNHYVILEKIVKNYCIIVDPNSGRVKISHDEFKKSFSQHIVLLEPNKKFVPLKNKNRILNYLKDILEYKSIIIFILVFSGLLQLISIGTPVLTQNIVDNIIISPLYSVSTLIYIALLFILMQLFITYFKNRLIILFQKKVDQQLLDRFVNHLIKLPYKFFQLRTCGDLMQRLSSNTIIRDVLIQKILPGFMNIILIFIIFIYMFIQSPLLTCVVVLLGLLQFGIILISKSKMKLLAQSQVMAQTESYTFLTELINGIATIKTLGVEKHISNEWEKILSNQIDKVAKKSKFQTNVDLITNTIMSFAPLFIIFLGISQVQNKSITIGKLFAFQSLTTSFLSPITFLATIINDITLLVVLLERIYDVLDEEAEIYDNKITKNLLGNISVNALSFRYSENSPYILKNISLNIKNGEKVAIVGKSGCGKSTLGLILCGLYKPTNGCIKIDDTFYNSISKNSFKNTFGVVMQDDFLFNKTISENICMGIDNVNFKEIENAAKIAAIHDEIKSLPMGYNTLLSESATNLSGGQKQRLSIARAIIRKPSVLLLDEATSSLDSLTEKIITDNMKMLNCTQIIIAHRLSTIKDADKIIILNNGEILDIGSHDELFNKCSYYQKLYEHS